MDLHPLRAALSSALVALDFDGTLAPISPHPDDARPLAGALQILCDVRATGATLAVVTGRTVASLLRVSGFGAVPGIVIYGTHGAERWQRGELRTPPVPPGLDELRLILPGLLTSITHDPDLWIEDKGLSLVIHARLTAEPERVLELLRVPVGEAVEAAGLGMRPGKEVLEICIPGIDKGTAIRELVGAETAAVFYAGDDLGDLPAIAEVKAWAKRSGRPALTVGVSPQDPIGPIAEQADVTVPDPQGLMSLLRQILLQAAPDGQAPRVISHERLTTRMSTPAGTAVPQRPARRLDRKLSNIAAGRYTPDDFVIADAKDADMAFGLTAAGPVTGAPAGEAGPGRYGTRSEYLGAMRALVAQGELDILLTSASNGQRLAEDGALEDMTLAIRANDTTDIWNNRGGRYPAEPSRPFRTADLAAVRPFCDLVLYSMTFNNDRDYDLATLEAYSAFRREAAAFGIRHFLEVFNPNAQAGLVSDRVGAFVNDSIIRALAGVTDEQRPIFLKVAYNGSDALAELAEHDPSVVVGVLGGSAGTTRDCFELLHRAERHGARVALFGRKIQRAEAQLDLVSLMRPVLRGELSPAGAVRAYHEALAKAGIAPDRELEADLAVTDPVLRS